MYVNRFAGNGPQKLKSFAPRKCALPPSQKMRSWRLLNSRWKQIIPWKKVLTGQCLGQTHLRWQPLLHRRSLQDQLRGGHQTQQRTLLQDVAESKVWRIRTYINTGSGCSNGPLHVHVKSIRQSLLHFVNNKIYTEDLRQAICKKIKIFLSITDVFIYNNQWQ